MVEKFPLPREPELRKVLDALGYELRLPPPPHTRLEAKGDGIRLTLYESGKLLLQGKREAEVHGELAAFGFFGGASPSKKEAPKGPASPSFLLNDDALETALIGSDETGKGDYFGPLVVCAVHLPPGLRAEMRSLGVRDSKLLSDAQSKKIAAEVRRRLTHEVVAIGPKKYNEMYADFKNVNKLLAWAHGRAIEAVLERHPDCPRALVDQFAADPGVVRRALGPLGRKINLEQRPRGEEELAVAAASIVARAVFLEKLTELSDRSGMVLEKGASAKVETAAKAYVSRWGAERLGEVAKLHFQTTGRVLGGAGPLFSKSPAPEPPREEE